MTSILCPGASNSFPEICKIFILSISANCLNNKNLGTNLKKSLSFSKTLSCSCYLLPTLKKKKTIIPSASKLNTIFKSLNNHLNAHNDLNVSVRNSPTQSKTRHLESFPIHTQLRYSKYSSEQKAAEETLWH